MTDRHPRMRAVGDELKAMRLRQGLTHDEVSALLAEHEKDPITGRTVLSYEYAARGMLVARLFGFADAFGVPASRIIKSAEMRLGEPPVCRGCGRA